MNKIEGISNLHGQTREVFFDSVNIKVMPLYHPAAMLYNGGLRKVLEKDFLKIKNFLD